MNSKPIRSALALVAAFSCGNALADSTAARCDVYPAGEDHTDVMIPCQFSQTQGHVTITRGDGAVHDLMPDENTPGNFTDQDGKTVYRQSGLADQGLIFRFPEESVYVYWNTAALDPDYDADQPFSTRDYDATTSLRCKGPDAEDYGLCPAGILRMEDGQASIVVQSPTGEQFTINFMNTGVSATNRTADATREGDTWTVVINGEERYQVPLAAIEGG